MKWSQLVGTFLLLLIMGYGMSGCGIFNTEPSADWGESPDGREILLDTARNWRDWREVIDPQLRAELSGHDAPGGVEWNESWILILRAIEKTQENAPKYIAYIIESRRRAGLPELEGYPTLPDE